MLGLLHLRLRPTGTDLAAQIARASFAHDHPLTPVDLSWYSGIHPFGYSVLSPYVMSAVGVRPAGLLAAVAGAMLLAHLLRTTAHPLAGSLLGAVFAVADVVSGRTSFALGAVAALAALAVRPRRLPCAILAVLTALLSPVAAAFLALAAAVLVLRRLPGGLLLGISATVPVALVAVLFPSGGIQPYEARSAPYAVLAGIVLASLTHSPALRTGGLLYAFFAAVLVLSPDPFGSNILRLGLLLAAPLVVATATEHWRVVAPVAAILVLWQVQPPYADLRAKPAPSFDALNAELDALGVHRAEVVPLRDHGEAAYVAPRVQLARGWSRQIDTARNPLFYKPALAAVDFHRWLVDNRVEAVALALDTRLDRGGRKERNLLLVGSVRGLDRVWSNGTWVIWLFRDAPPLVGEPVHLVAADRTQMHLVAPRAAYVDIGVRWSRWLSITGPACVERHGAATRVRFRRAGTATLGSALRPEGHC